MLANSNSTVRKLFAKWSPKQILTLLTHMSSPIVWLCPDCSFRTCNMGDKIARCHFSKSNICQYGFISHSNICLTHTHTHTHTESRLLIPSDSVSLLHTRIYAHKLSQQHRQTNKLNQKKKISGRSWGSASFLCLLSLSLLSVVMEGGRGGGMFADAKSINPTQIFLCPRDHVCSAMADFAFFPPRQCSKKEKALI